MTVPRTKVQFSYRNRPELEDAEDFLTLPNLDEVSIFDLSRSIKTIKLSNKSVQHKVCAVEPPSLGTYLNGGATL